MGQLFRKMHSRLATIYDEHEARQMALMALNDIVGLSTVDVLMGQDDQLDAGRQAQIDQAFGRLLQGEPIQYVIGHTEFCQLQIGVASGVLIPRPETEELVRAVVEHVRDTKERDKKRISTAETSDEIDDFAPCDAEMDMLDIGTGSGCIALALKHLCPRSSVTAFDISNEALTIAQRNAERLHLQVDFRLCDILSAPLPDDAWLDVVVSNPPYICESEKREMDDNVLSHEPHLALFVPDDDPLRFYRAITLYASKALRSDGLLAFEVNRRFAHEVADCMLGGGFANIEIRKDSYDNHRMVIGRRRNER